MVYVNQASSHAVSHRLVMLSRGHRPARPTAPLPDAAPVAQPAWPSRVGCDFLARVEAFLPPSLPCHSSHSTLVVMLHSHHSH